MTDDDDWTYPSDHKITQAEALELMRKWAEEAEGDAEGPHIYADDLMVRILRQFGWSDVADVYDKMNRWYA